MTQQGFSVFCLWKDESQTKVWRFWHLQYCWIIWESWPTLLCICNTKVRTLFRPANSFSKPLQPTWRSFTPWTQNFALLAEQSLHSAILVVFCNVQKGGVCFSHCLLFSQLWNTAGAPGTSEKRLHICCDNWRSVPGPFKISRHSTTGLHYDLIFSSWHECTERAQSL